MKYRNLSCHGLSFVALLLATAISMPAAAKTNRELLYNYSQVWSTAVRFIRVEMGYSLVEKDKKAGYLLFEYKEGEKETNGSIEIVQVERGGRRMVDLKIQIPSMPTYVEAVLADKLVIKLREEHGEPVMASQTPQTPESASEKKSDKKANASVSGEPPKDEDDAEVDEEDLNESAEEEK